MRKWSKEQKRRIVEESFRPAARVASVARACGVRPGQIFEWRRAYKEGRLDGDSETPTLLPIRLSDVFPPPRIHIHGATDPVTLGIVLECLAP